jgi:dTDP-glucose pyrophosphorylase
VGILSFLFRFFRQGIFFKFLAKDGAELTSEYYIPDLIDRLIETDEAEVKVLSSDSNWFGVTYKEDKPHVVAKLNEMIDNGLYPRDLWK